MSLEKCRGNRLSYGTNKYWYIFNPLGSGVGTAELVGMRVRDGIVKGLMVSSEGMENLGELCKRRLRLEGEWLQGTGWRCSRNGSSKR